ncbi:hypothetical protein BRADI_3g05296v3 [Brachypodium distachyon]|uniref:Uncharacterized protein n=1 Tax=Brachypodium distachyon TaxID=15368 RepID=A0A0Q3F253_BRADI|nr:hypothetical protein BRADI_3g05296v3 [Brachypodium distachyon]
MSKMSFRALFLAVLMIICALQTVSVQGGHGSVSSGIRNAPPSRPSGRVPSRHPPSSGSGSSAPSNPGCGIGPIQC